MSQYARLATHKEIEIIPSERPFSHFGLVDDKFGGLDTLRRILTQARCQGVKTTIVETLGTSTDLQEENQDMSIALGKTPISRALRLTFFSKQYRTKTDLHGLNNDHFIGYAIIKEDRIDNKTLYHIYESVIRKSPHAHNFIRGEQTWECLVNNTPLRVKGYLYAQQNGVTNVCAHAALRTVAARFRPEKALSNREINITLGIDHTSRKASKGVGNEEIVKVLESLGAICYVGDFDPRQNPPAPFHKFIYSSIESGYPVIVFFETTRSTFHTIPIFGHTFNQDTWVPSADRCYFAIGHGPKYIPSDSWLSMFVGHDDNVGSNICIPRHYLQTKSVARLDGAGTPTTGNSVAYIISAMPGEVKFDPVGAEAVGAGFLFNILPKLPNLGTNKWSNRLHHFARINQLVLRPLLISGSEYVNHIGRISDWNKRPILPNSTAAIRHIDDSKLLWMVELSIPDLFSANKRKLGEVLFRPDDNHNHPGNANSFVLARLPGYFAQLTTFDSTKSNYTFRFTLSGISDHTEVFGCEEG